MASVVEAAVPGSGLPLGTGSRGPLTVLEGGVCHDAAGTVGGGGPEATRSGAPSVPTSVLSVLPDVTAGELAWATGVPVANGTGEGVTPAIVSDVPLRTLVTLVTDTFFLAALSVLLRTKCP